MGCGTSKLDPLGVVAPTANGGGEEGDDVAKELPARKLDKTNSKLGEKTVQDSFAVQKTRGARKDQGAEAGGEQGEQARKQVVERDPDFKPSQDELSAGNPLSLPAESSVVAQPAMQGPSASGPSFKMARGSQAKILAELQQQKGQLQEVGAYKAKLYGDGDAEVLEGVTYFREQLSVVNPPVAAVREMGILPRLVVLLGSSENHKLQYEVAWILTNICSAEHEDCQDVVDQGVVPKFVGLLGTCKESDVLEQAIWALGNIAADCLELQKLVLDEGVVPPLLQCMQRNAGSTSLVRHSSWLLSNLCRPRPQDRALLEAIPQACSIIATCKDSESVTHACWALTYLTGEEEALDLFMDAPDHAAALQKLVGWVAEGNSNVTTPALRVLGNLCSGNAEHTQAVLDAGGLPAMLSCMEKCERVSLKKEVIWSLSNVAAGTSDQVVAMAKAGVFPAVVALMKGSEESLKRECAFVLANPWSLNVGVTYEAGMLLLQEKLVEELVDLLDLGTDVNILKVAIDGLQDAIKRGQMMMRVEAAAYNDAHPYSEDAPQEDPPMFVNKVAEAAKEHDAMDRLQGLFAHTDDSIHPKANSLKNILQFM